ncbi:hypothetical protein B0I37DRAFT_48476 [Chaetomium sp. MPI-CAGE-AT-0009]|nr:hypothetical protein B0I37DRAFT_48476 [Chaetomium sp. MPI-CAGE-AT-0009]
MCRPHATDRSVDLGNPRVEKRPLRSALARSLTRMDVFPDWESSFRFGKMLDISLFFAFLPFPSLPGCRAGITGVICTVLFCFILSILLPALCVCIP